MERGLAQLMEYRDDGGPFPDRLHITVLFADLCARLIQAVESWTAEAAVEIESWPRMDGLGKTPSTARRLDTLIAQCHAVLARPVQPVDPSSI